MWSDVRCQLSVKVKHCSNSHPCILLNKQKQTHVYSNRYTSTPMRALSRTQTQLTWPDHVTWTRIHERLLPLSPASGMTLYSCTKWILMMIIEAGRIASLHRDVGFIKITSSAKIWECGSYGKCFRSLSL